MANYKKHIKILERTKTLILKEMRMFPDCSAYICIAIRRQEGDTKTRFALIGWIDKMLGKHFALSSWLRAKRENQVKVYTIPEVNAARVQWIDWMIATLKAESDHNDHKK